MKKIKSYIKLMRPHHYIKNFLIFLPIIFSRNVLNTKYLIPTIVGLISFCLISSVVYIFNDIMDVENDRKHEKKKYRPIASGQVTIKNASLLAIVLFVISICLNIYIKRTNYIIFVTFYIYNN